MREQRIQRLQQLTEALGYALSEAQVARVVLENGLPALGADAGSIARLSSDGTELELLGAHGYESQLVASFFRFRVDQPLPLSTAARTGEPIFAESRAELLRLHGGVEPAAAAVISLPLFAHGHLLGVMGVTFSEPRRFTPEEREFALTVGRLCAQALERAQVFEREQRARQEAEAAQARLDLLARVSHSLLGTLDQEQACQRLARLVIDSGLAELAVVDLVEGAVLTRVAIESRDPALAAQTWAHPEAVPDLNQEGHAVVAALRSRAPQLASSVDPVRWSKLFPSQEWRDLARSFRIRSYVVVPLVGRSEVLGALSLLTSDSFSRALGPHDLLLAQELSARASAALESARLYAEAKEAIRARDEFLSIAGHELRTPLTALKLQLQSALRILGPEETPLLQRKRVAERTEKAAYQVDRLSALVDRLLDVSRITAGRFALEPEPLDLGDLAREACTRFNEEMIASGCQLQQRIAGPAPGVWDRMRLEQLLANLLSNAIKYGRARPVDVRVDCDGSRAMLWVRDHGEGIALADQARLFERFERGSRARHVGGLGLGLWISRCIAQAHGGSLTVRSEPGQGAEFCLVLPQTPPA